MAKMYLDSTDNLIAAAKDVAANPNTTVVLNGTPISNQTLVSLASNQAMQGASSANAIVPYAGNNFTGMSNNLGAQPVTLSPSTLALSNSPTITAAQQSAVNLAGKEQTVTPLTTSSIANLGGAGVVVDANKINTQGTGPAGTGTTGTGTAGTGTAGTGTAGTGTAGTGTAGTGTAGTGTAGTGTAGTGTANAEKPWWFGYNDAEDALGAGVNPPTNTGTSGTGATPEKVVTPPVTPPSGLTLADLKGLGYLTKSDFDTANSTLKSDILTGVDAKNKAFGTQATQGFMDAFKNFQIPINQQTGVNLGNYNDNRNAAADQWWSQYVTGRR